MKLQKRFAYEYKRKKYYKHLITIPDKTLKELGWKPGANLEQVIENGKLVIKPRHQSTEGVKSSESLLREKLRKVRGE
jgi:bifunctional DNA-binding transcriptional regulator/antitoxin component of YhaV-PrlF toxin-antitoxin module